MSLNEQQRAKLLEGITPERVSQRRGPGGAQLSYVEAWDIKAHLIRIFGFGGFSADVVDHKVEHLDGKFLAQVRLRLHIPSLGCTYTEVAASTNADPDMAVKTAESDALKRCAVYLGDQFGLSLYNNGSARPVIGHEPLSHGETGGNA